MTRSTSSTWSERQTLSRDARCPVRRAFLTLVMRVRILNRDGLLLRSMVELGITADHGHRAQAPLKTLSLNNQRRCQLHTIIAAQTILPSNLQCARYDSKRKVYDDKQRGQIAL